MVYRDPTWDHTFDRLLEGLEVSAEDLRRFLDVLIDVFLLDDPDMAERPFDEQLTVLEVELHLDPEDAAELTEVGLAEYVVAVRAVKLWREQGDHPA